MLQKGETIVDRLFAEIERRGGSVPKFSIETGIPKDRVYKWKQQGTAPKADDERKIWKWLNLDIAPHEMHAYRHKESGLLLNEPDPNEILRPSKYEAASGQQTALEAILNLTESNKKLADANMIMVRMLEEKYSSKGGLSKKTLG